MLLVLAAPGWTEVGRPAGERFADPQTREVPDFQRHVVPLLSRMGCNGRACHGSFQGQGGFRLSLFGHDFGQDHQALTRRVSQGTPADSLVLQKPTLQLSHRGGRRFDRESWPYQLLLRWIEGGARGLGTGQQLQRLEVSPAEMVLRRPGDSTPLRVVAHWVDGTQEDVTCLCRFQVHDEAIAEVDAGGRVSARGKGDTHVVAFYDSGVAAVPLLVPVTDRAGADYPQVATSTKIDELIVARLRKLGVVPSALCSDAEFLRRLSLDLTGTLPTPNEIEKFVADSSPRKRIRKIDELLDNPAHAAWWTNRLCDITGNSRFGQSEGRIGQQLAVQWYAWIYRRVRDNTPYDRLVEGIILASGRRDGQTYEDYAAEMSSYFRAKEPADFAARPTLPYYWTRQTVAKPEDRALSFAHSFLGLRLQCAQCHKHPHDQWTQDDFKQFTAFFAGVRYGVAPVSQEGYRRVAQAVGQRVPANQGIPITQELLALAEEGKTIPWRELHLETGRAGQLRLLGDEARLASGEDPRRLVMDWLRRRGNPYFARALVNRVWANYFHAGLVEPVDDLNRANPPSNPELLDYLARDFIEHGYDLKRLHRLITSSDAYQRSWKPNETNRLDRRNYSRAVPRRMPAEVVYDALAQATAADDALLTVRRNLERRAIGHLSTHLAGTYAMHVFGKPDRVAACDCERSNEPTLLQAVFLNNDPLLQERLQESGWLKQIALAPQDKLDTRSLIHQAYLRTVSRAPTKEELARARRHVDEAASPAEGLRDLLWALLNSKEFILNH
jgi:hypothetical protein